MIPRKPLQMAGVGTAGAVMAALLAASPATGQQLPYIPCAPQALVAAITSANTAGGGQLLLSPGCTYTLTTPVTPGADNGLPQITTPISLVGLGVIISRGSAAPAFRILDVATRGSLTLSGITVTGGAPRSDGGGIRNAGKLTLKGTTIRGNSAGTQGGGISSSGTLVANASSIRANAAVTGGGGIADSGTVNLFATTIDGNNVLGPGSKGGGLLNSGGMVTGHLTTFGDNTAPGPRSSGGALATIGGSVNMRNGTIILNRAATAPGGILNDHGNVALALTAVWGNTPTNCTGSPTPVTGCLH